MSNRFRAANEADGQQHAQGPFHAVSDGVESEFGDPLCKFEPDIDDRTKALLACSWSLHAALVRLTNAAVRNRDTGAEIPRSVIAEAHEVLNVINYPELLP